VLALFRETRVESPAAALAAWKRRGGPRATLGKPWEAAIALLNPVMAPEFRALDRAELVLWFDGDAGIPRWYATLPQDDGSFTRVATALALTDGGPEPPLGKVAVDRLGPAPWPLATRPPGPFVLADSRDSLGLGLASPRGPGGHDRVEALPVESGWTLDLDPEELGRSRSLLLQRLAQGLRGLGCRTAWACAGLDDETAGLTVDLRLDGARVAAPPLEPAWVERLPAARVLAAFAVALGSDGAAWDRIFAAADRIERADPTHAEVVPMRTRINLLAAAVKVRPEVDLWPHLRGLSGALLVDPAGAVDGAIVALHADSREAAERIAADVLPALSPLLGVRKPAAGAELPELAWRCGVRLLGTLNHRPVYLVRQDDSVRLGWGESALEPLVQVPVAGSLRKHAHWGAAPPQRFGAFWPGRLPRAAALARPLAAMLADAPAVAWTGRDQPAAARESVRWPGLRRLVQDLVATLPLDPPPPD
jgi:hypothetical protein